MLKVVTSFMAIAVAGTIMGCSPEGFSTVDYRGETIRLAKTYPDFDTYKDDPQNLHLDEIPRVASLVKTAPVQLHFASREEAQDASLKLMFPGYGFSMLALDKPIALYAIEIPQLNQERYLTYENKEGSWTLVDDFIWSSDAGLLSSAEYVDGELRYYDSKGAVVRERK
jgi:hypothetical protein